MMTLYRKQAFALVLAALAILTGPPALSASQDDPPATRETTDKTANSSAEREAAATSDAKPAGEKPSKTAKGAGKSKKDNEIFRPSEEISEDFAVSFPVDI